MNRLGITGWTAIACALAGSACPGEELSVGELRCAGRGVRCEWPSASGTSVDELQHSPHDHTAIEHAPERPAELLWARELPCPRELCLPLRAVVHEDGSATVMQQYYRWVSDQMTAPRGIGLVHIDPHGALIWEDQQTIVHPNAAPGSVMAELALDSEDRALVAVSEEIDGERDLSLYRIGEAGQIDKRFVAPEVGDVMALAAKGDSFWVAAFYEQQLELSRFDARGELVWRQAGLTNGPPPNGLDGLGSDGQGLFYPIGLAVDTQERALLTVAELNLPNLLRVRADGNLDQRELLANIRPGGPLLGPLDHAELSVDGRDRASVSAGTGRLTRHDLEHEPLLVQLRQQEEYWAPDLLALAHDADDRTLAVSHDGDRGVPRLLIERVSEDFGRHETFVVSGAEPLLAEPLPDEPLGFTTVQGLGATQGGALLWTDTHLARIALED